LWPSSHSWSIRQNISNFCAFVVARIDPVANTTTLKSSRHHPHSTRSANPPHPANAPEIHRRAPAQKLTRYKLGRALCSKGRSDNLVTRPLQGPPYSLHPAFPSNLGICGARPPRQTHRR